MSGSIGPRSAGCAGSTTTSLLLSKIMSSLTGSATASLLLSKRVFHKKQQPIINLTCLMSYNKKSMICLKATKAPNHDIIFDVQHGNDYQTCRTIFNVSFSLRESSLNRYPGKSKLIIFCLFSYPKIYETSGLPLYLVFPCVKGRYRYFIIC